MVVYDTAYPYHVSVQCPLVYDFDSSEKTVLHVLKPYNIKRKMLVLTRWLLQQGQIKELCSFLIVIQPEFLLLYNFGPRGLSAMLVQESYTYPHEYIWYWTKNFKIWL